MVGQWRPGGNARRGRPGAPAAVIAAAGRVIYAFLRANGPIHVALMLTI